MDGGSCSHGQSDIYIHCSIDEDVQVQMGSWTEWEMAEESEMPGKCGEEQLFQQWERKCDTDTLDTLDIIPFCPGPWMKVRWVKYISRKKWPYCAYYHFQPIND